MPAGGAARARAPRTPNPPPPPPPPFAAPADLPLSEGASALFVLKRKGRLCVTDPAPVAAGGAEWHTSCRQAVTLRKEGDGWRGKEFTFKVQVLKGAQRARAWAGSRLI